MMLAPCLILITDIVIQKADHERIKFPGAGKTLKPAGCYPVSKVIDNAGLRSAPREKGLFAEKQIGKQRQDEADYNHRGNRNKNEFFIAFDTNIARQFPEPTEESGQISQDKADDRYPDTDNYQ
jgi:hypothetical protein